MLTPLEKRRQANELQENYKRLDQDLITTLNDLQITEKELQCVLNMKHEDPGNCWKVRDYLEDKLTEKGILVYPFTKMADHSANKWFYYETPWRNK